MDSIALLQKYYKDNKHAYAILLAHSKAVAKKALEIAKKLPGVDTQFLKEAAMLHDIGICKIGEPLLACTGKYHYICHGYLGREMLEAEGFPKHALVAERHVGMGFTLFDIKRENLPLPLRDMQPVSIEEKIICFADKFFTKRDLDKPREMSFAKVAAEAKSHGAENVAKLMKLAKELKYKP